MNKTKSKRDKQKGGRKRDSKGEGGALKMTCKCRRQLCETRKGDSLIA